MLMEEWASGFAKISLRRLASSHQCGKVGRLMEAADVVQILLLHSSCAL